MDETDVRFFVLLFGFFSVAFGACVGSFLNVCIYRVPRGESVVKPRSHCPHCGAMIPWYLNIPVLSWLCLRGKCANCKGPISFRYTLVEMLTALLFLAVYVQLVAPYPLRLAPINHPAVVPCYWLALAGLIVATFVDFEHFIIPDSVSIGGMVAGPILGALVPALHGEKLWYMGLADALLGDLVGFGLLFAIAEIGTRVFKKEAMGFGDVKLMGAIGAFLGWRAVLFVLFVASFLGSIVGIILMIFGGVKLQSRIPFGPYLAGAAAIWIYWGPVLMGLYLSLMKSGA
ncbi:MAG: prepilin peptidase [Kiritimatiellae bacterium]|nr:prepilin peptidase [Kiritimatiellia bacterium]